MEKFLSCKYNMDNTCVKLCYANSSEKSYE